MAVKKRSETAASKAVTQAQAEALANELADKPYDRISRDAIEAVKPQPADKRKSVPISVSLPPGIIEQLEDAAVANKRAGGVLKSVSAIIKDALEEKGFKL
ncbi:hypothetical protein [Pseudomonas viridiflava]